MVEKQRSNLRDKIVRAARATAPALSKNNRHHRMGQRTIALEKKKRQLKELPLALNIFFVNEKSKLLSDLTS